MSGVNESLDVLLADGVIDDVLGRIMSGKEAEVFAVTYKGTPVAAKVYKPRWARNFKNNAGYLEGRAQVRDSRTRRAMEKGTSFGKAAAEKGWMETEHDALQLAWHAGVRVPEPIFLYEETLLMQLVVDHEGMPAPRLSDMNFGADHAEEIHRDIFEQIKKLLGCHRIHGDLSAFNVLMGVDGPTIIDMPQVIDAASNQQAEEFLIRDVRNVTEYLARYSPKLFTYANAGRALWHHYRRGTLEEAVAHEVVENVNARRGRGDRAQPPKGPPRQALPDGRVEVVVGQPGRGRNNRFTRHSSGTAGGRQGGNNAQAQGRHEGEQPRPRGPQPPREGPRAPQPAPQGEPRSHPPRQEHRGPPRDGGHQGRGGGGGGGGGQQPRPPRPQGTQPPREGGGGNQQPGRPQPGRPQGGGGNPRGDGRHRPGGRPSAPHR